MRPSLAICEEGVQSRTKFNQLNLLHYKLELKSASLETGYTRSNINSRERGCVQIGTLFQRTFQLNTITQNKTALPLPDQINGWEF